MKTSNLFATKVSAHLIILRAVNCYRILNLKFGNYLEFVPLEPGICSYIKFKLHAYYPGG